MKNRTNSADGLIIVTNREYTVIDNWINTRPQFGRFLFTPSGDIQSGFNYLVDTILKSVEKSDGDFCFLDTFLTDTISQASLEKIFKQTSGSSRARILLVNPNSAYASERARVVLPHGDPLTEVKNGLKLIFKALGNALPSQHDFQKILTDEPDVSTILKKLPMLGPDAQVSIKFYSRTPGGPSFFFRNCVMFGVFPGHKSSASQPWCVSFDNPGAIINDYNILREEFDEFWDNYSIQFIESN